MYYPQSLGHCQELLKIIKEKTPEHLKQFISLNDFIGFIDNWSLEEPIAEEQVEELRNDFIDFITIQRLEKSQEKEIDRMIKIWNSCS